MTRIEVPPYCPALYLPAAPLLWFSREAMQAHGWSVLQVVDALAAVVAATDRFIGGLAG